MLATYGHLLDGPSVGRYLQLIALACTAVAVWWWGRRHGALGPLAAVAVAVTPHLLWQASTADDDLLLALSALAFCFAIIQSLRGEGGDDIRGLSFALGLMAGMAPSLKLHLTPLFAVLMLGFIVAGRKPGHGVASPGVRGTGCRADFTAAADRPLDQLGQPGASLLQQRLPQPLLAAGQRNLQLPLLGQPGFVRPDQVHLEGGARPLADGAGRATGGLRRARRRDRDRTPLRLARARSPQGQPRGVGGAAGSDDLLVAIAALPALPAPGSLRLGRARAPSHRGRDPRATCEQDRAGGDHARRDRLTTDHYRPVLERAAPQAAAGRRARALDRIELSEGRSP